MSDCEWLNECKASIQVFTLSVLRSSSTGWLEHTAAFLQGSAPSVQARRCVTRMLWKEVAGRNREGHGRGVAQLGGPCSSK